MEGRYSGEHNVAAILYFITGCGIKVGDRVNKYFRGSIATDIRLYLARPPLCKDFEQKGFSRNHATYTATSGLTPDISEP